MKIQKYKTYKNYKKYKKIQNMNYGSYTYNKIKNDIFEMFQKVSNKYKIPKKFECILALWVYFVQ